MKKLLLGILICGMLFTAVPFALSASAGGVTEIGSEAELVALMADPTKWDGDYVLTKDLDLTGLAQSPIGSHPDTPFTGAFDGNGYTISGLDIQADGWAGLFGVVKGGTVKNVTVEGTVANSFVPTNAETQKDGYEFGTGGVVGVAYGGSTIENCVNYAEIHSPGNAGGVVGFIRNRDANAVYLTDCVNYGNVVSTIGNNGGVAGNFRCNNANGSIIVSGCWNHADILCDAVIVNRLGGIVGYLYIGNGAIEVVDCGNTGNLTGENLTVPADDSGYSRISGIVGRAEVKTGADHLLMRGCVNTGDIQSNRYAAGIMSSFLVESGASTTPTEIIDCANYGDVVGLRWAGGIIGYAEAKDEAVIRNCLNNGAVFSEYSAGGIISRWYGIDLDQCVSLGEVSCTATAGGLAGTAAGTSTYKATATDCYYVTAPSIGATSSYCSESESVAVAANEVSATLDDVIGLNFYINTALYDGATGATLANESETAELASEQVMEDGRTRYTFYIVPAKIGTDYTFTLEGTYFKKVISVADYLKQLSGTPAEPVANALLTYGEASAAYFAKKTFTETAEMEAVTEDTLTDYKPAYSATSIGDLTLVGNSFVFTEAAKTKHLFTLAEGGDIAEYTFTYQFAGEDAVPVDAVPNGNYYTVTVPGIDAKRLSKTYTLTVTKDEEKMEITYSALSYAYLLLKNCEVESLKPAVPLAKALYLYSVEADAYVQ